MHRLTAKLLLLFALLGSLVPVALASVAAPPRACCMRKGMHHCHESAGGESSGLVFRDACGCGQSGGRAVTSVRWAHAQPAPKIFLALALRSRIDGPQSHSPKTAAFGSRSSRAPPSC